MWFQNKNCNYKFDLQNLNLVGILGDVDNLMEALRISFKIYQKSIFLVELQRWSIIGYPLCV